MVDASHQIADTLKENGYSLTLPRRAVFDALQNSEPQTMHELITRVGSRADRASTYRTIELFEKLAIVQRLQIGWKYKLELSDKFMHHHHHLTCLNCGKVIPIHENAVFEEQLVVLAKKSHFKSIDHQLEIRGFCQSCQT